MEYYIIVLFAQQYQITDENTGEITKGCTIWYHPSGDLKPRVKASNGSLGRKTCKGNLPYDMFDRLKACPGLYKAEVEMEANTNNKAVFNILDIEFVSELEVVQKNDK